MSVRVKVVLVVAVRVIVVVVEVNVMAKVVAVVVAAIVVVVSVMVVVPPLPDEPHVRFAPNQRPCPFSPHPPDRFRPSRAPLPPPTAPCPVGKFSSPKRHTHQTPSPGEPHDRFTPNQRPCLFSPHPPGSFRPSRAPLPHSPAPCPVGKFLACFALGSHSFFFFTFFALLHFF